MIGGYKMTFTEWLKKEHNIKTIQDFWGLPEGTQVDLEAQYENNNKE